MVFSGLKCRVLVTQSPKYFHMVNPVTCMNVGTSHIDTKSLLALYPCGITRRDPPSCEAPREPTIYALGD